MSSRTDTSASGATGTLRRILIAAVVASLLLLAWVAAGPWLAIRGIEQAIEKRDTAKLERYVDFPRLRANLKAQIDDRIVRAAGGSVAGNLLGAAALALTGNATRLAVETIATPLGIGALLQGHVLWQRASGDTTARACSLKPNRPARCKPPATATNPCRVSAPPSNIQTAAAPYSCSNARACAGAWSMSACPTTSPPTCADR